MTLADRPRRGDTAASSRSAPVQSVARRAVLWMLIAVVGYAFLPLIVWAGVRDMSPFMFVVVWYVLSAVWQAIFRQAWTLFQSKRECGSGSGSRLLVGSATAPHRDQQQPQKRLTMVEDIKRVKPRYFWLSAVTRLQWLLFALAITLVEPVIATVVFEFWPVAFGLLTLTPIWRERMLEGGSLGKGGLAGVLMMLVVSGVGVSLAVVSDSGVISWSSTATVGVLLAVLSTFLHALSAIASQMMGADQLNVPESQHSVEPESSVVRSQVEPVRSAEWEITAVSTSSDAASKVLVTPFIALAGFCISGFGISLAPSVDLWATSSVLLAIAAAATQVSANWCFQHANHLARNAHGPSAAQINTLYYLVPVGALLLLVWLADTTIERPDLLIVGAAGVVVVNMVLHLDPEGAQQRGGGAGGQGYQAFVLALWAAGAAVLFRDDWLPGGWEVWSVVEYWGIVGVCATVFTLILSFRQSRLAERRREMDALMLRLHQQIVFMGASGDLAQPTADESGRLLRTIDTAREAENLRDAYFALRKLLIEEMDPESDRERAKRLSDLLVEIEVLVNLRQQGRNFTELAVLGLFALLIVALTVAARPDGSIEPFAGWVHDTTSMVIGAAFAFLGFDLIDKRREVDAPTLRQVTPLAHTVYGQPQGWRLELVSYRDQSTDRMVASLLGAVLLVGAVVMLGINWL